MINDCIKLNRAFLKWECFNKPEMVQLYLYFLLQANTTATEWQGMTIGVGQFVTSRKDINKMTGLSDRTIRTCIDKLKATHKVTSKTTNKYTVVTVCDFENYLTGCNVFDQQNDQRNDQRGTKKGASKSTTNRFIKPTMQDVKNYIAANSFPVDAERFYNYYEANGWKVGRNQMKDWKAAVRTWKRQSDQIKGANVGIILKDNNPDKYNETLW